MKEYGGKGGSMQSRDVCTEAGLNNNALKMPSTAGDMTHVTMS